MNWFNNKIYLKGLLVGLIGFSLLFCCGASFQLFLDVGSSMDHIDCGMAGMTGSSDSIQSQHNYMIVISFIKLLNNFIFILFVSILFTIVSCNGFRLYLKNIRDKYGGFNFFNYFLRLFGAGILHPKTF